MNKNLRWKVILSAAVFLLFFVTGVYPILAQRYGMPLPGWLADKQLRLGLDLRGGVHLVMRVHTDDALRTQTTMTSEQLREAMRNPSYLYLHAGFFTCGFCFFKHLECNGIRPSAFFRRFRVCFSAGARRLPRWPVWAMVAVAVLLAVGILLSLEWAPLAEA